MSLVAEPGAMSPRPGERAWSPEDEADLATAVAALEHTSFATQLSALLGRQIGFAGQFIPEAIARAANAAAAKALSLALRTALTTLPRQGRPASRRMHLAAVAASGAVGGAFGLATLPLELPLSTTLILRSIAAIADEEGENLAEPETAIACLEVFALSGGGEAAHLGEGGYFATRALLAKSVSEAARYFVNRGLIEETAPALLRLVAQIASRFGLVLSQKLLAQSLPVLGAVTGAAINAAFMEHYQRLARAHFTIRRLERVYGKDVVREAFDRLKRPLKQDGDAAGQVASAATPIGAPQRI